MSRTLKDLPVELRRERRTRQEKRRTRARRERREQRVVVLLPLRDDLPRAA